MADAAAEPDSGQDTALVAESGLFDLGYYVNQRPVSAVDLIAAIKDYLAVGWLANADPSSRFSTLGYLRAYPDVARSGQNPLLHYLIYGAAEGRVATAPETPADMPDVPAPVAPTEAEWGWLTDTYRRSATEALVDVVIPVYAGFDETLRCIFSVLTARQTTPYQVVLVNDCTPDAALAEQLTSLAERRLASLQKTPRNIGFVGACNLGMALHPGRDVILLNADTEVHGDWLDRLRAASLRDRRIATVTPLSNNAEICSYPNFIRNNRKRLEVDDAELDRLAASANRGRELDLPTGVGFCMYIRRECLDAIGLLDVENFGRGYGEENDLCRRAAKAGWRNVLAPDVFVRHHGGVSFGASKPAGKSAAAKTMERLHPEYDPLVRTFVLRDPIRPFRETLDLARLARRAGAGALLFVKHTWGGGAERHAVELADLLERNHTPVFVCRVAREKPGLLQIEDPALSDTPNLPAFDVARDVERFAQVLKQVNVIHVHVQHLAGMPDSAADFIRKAAQSAGLGYDVTVHDYIAICPRIALVDRSGYYCGEPPEEVCERCIARDGSPVGRPSVWEWRERYARLLSGARRVFAPDPDVIERLRRYLPDVRYELRPHTLEATNHQPTAPAAPRCRDGRRRIAILGAISPEKGSGLLLETARVAKARGLPLDFIVIGQTDRDKDFEAVGNVTISGRYPAAEAQSRLIAAEPDLVWFPAVCPETFSYTLSEVFATGLFPVAFDLGALGTRIRAARWGNVWPAEAMFDPVRVCRMLLKEPVPPFRHSPVPLACPDYSDPLRSYYGFAPGSPV